MPACIIAQRMGGWAEERHRLLITVKYEGILVRALKANLKKNEKGKIMGKI